jgi:hypothetical protein
MIRNIAFIPWGREFMNDEMFMASSPYNRDNGFMSWIKCREKFSEMGISLHTIDKYDDISDIDIICFFWFDDYWYRKVKKRGLLEKTIYIAFEPPVVDKNHSPRGINELKSFFHYILTWNDDLVDNQRVFKFMYPYWFDYSTANYLKFNEKNKLLINISSNKSSNVRDELYSERKKVIRYFDAHKDFELYGPGWEKEKLSSYKGMASSKKEAYSSGMFALCLENMKNVKGYITEKILDCFCAGIVPIYQGASNVSEYIPDDCYIHYDKFGNLGELENYLASMNEKEYNRFLESARKYLESDMKNCFLPFSFTQAILSPFNEFSNATFKPKRSWTVKSISRDMKLLAKKVKNHFFIALF